MRFIFIILISQITFVLYGQESTDIPLKLTLVVEYPKKAFERGITGIVKIRITLDSTCTIVKKIITNSIDYECDEAVLKSMVKIESQIKKQSKNKCKQGKELELPFKFFPPEE